MSVGAEQEIAKPTSPATTTTIHSVDYSYVHQHTLLKHLEEPLNSSEIADETSTSPYIGVVSLIPVDTGPFKLALRKLKRALDFGVALTSSFYQRYVDG